MDIKEVWNRLIQMIKSYPGVNPSQIDAFFSRIQIQAVSSGFIMLTSSNGFIKDWVEHHYVKDIKRALEDIYGVEFLVQIEIDTTAEGNEENTLEPVAVSEKQDRSRIEPPHETDSARHDLEQQAMPNDPEAYRKHPAAPLDAQPPAQQAQRNPGTTQEGHRESATADTTTSSLTFDSFVVGDSNSLAYAMAIDVAERPGISNLNPLFLYGRSGVGKTHLMCAIKNYISEQYPKLNVIYIDSMELVNRYSDAAREKSVDKSSFKNFENFFKDADVLLIDDIQSLQGKEGTLNTLFRIFNANIHQGKQFVFSADRAPKNIDLEERYTSRFNSGATIDIQPPDDETKRSIIKNFIQQYQQDEDFDFDLSDDILDYIVEHSGSNIRELKSAITNVIFAIKMNKDNLTAQDIKDMLSNHFINESGNRFTIEAVQAAVEDFYHVSHNDLVSKSRSRAIAHPRQVAIYLSRELINTTYAEIGKAFNRDHSTIVHSCLLIEKKLNEDRNLREEIEVIRKNLRMHQY